MASILTSVSILLYQLVVSQEKNQVAADVEQEGVQVMQMITQSVRNSAGVNSP